MVPRSTTGSGHITRMHQSMNKLERTRHATRADCRAPTRRTGTTAGSLEKSLAVRDFDAVSIAATAASTRISTRPPPRHFAETPRTDWPAIDIQGSVDHGRAFSI
jgi:hypothetical protein